MDLNLKLCRDATESGKEIQDLSQETTWIKGIERDTRIEKNILLGKKKEQEEEWLNLLPFHFFQTITSIIFHDLSFLLYFPFHNLLDHPIFLLQAHLLFDVLPFQIILVRTQLKE